MRPLVLLFSAVAACWAGVAWAEPADDPAPVHLSTSRQGLRGIYWLDIAESLPDGRVVLSATGEYFKTSNFLVDGDQHQRLGWRGFLSVSPYGPVDLVLSWSSTSNKNTPNLTQSTQTLGDPSLTLKVAHPVMKNLGAGASIEFLLPTSAEGTGLNAKAFVLTGLVLASYEVADMLTIALNAGYRLDNSDKMFSDDFPPELAPIMRFNAGIASTNAIVGGLGAEAHFDVNESLRVAPFLELSAALGQGVGMSENPIRVGGGIKTVLFPSSALELGVGGDYRLSGEPSPNGKLPGIPPWEVFFRLGLQIPVLDSGAPARVAACEGPPKCDPSTPCDEGLSCIDGRCGVLREITREVPKEVIKEVVKEAPAFTLAGKVTSSATKEVVKNAVVRLSGYDKTPISTGKDGAYQTWPLKVDDGILQVTVEAPGFQPSQQTMSKGPAGETKTLDVALVPITGKQPPGIVRGILKDQRTGRPVAGLVVLPSVNKRLRAKADGTFEAEIDPGNYDVIISSPKHQTQTKEITISSGEVVILNIDLNPKRR